MNDGRRLSHLSKSLLPSFPKISHTDMRSKSGKRAYSGAMQSPSQLSAHNTKKNLPRFPYGKVTNTLQALL